MNISNVWKNLRFFDLEISKIYNNYALDKKQKTENTVPGRRTIFNTVTEFVFPCTLGIDPTTATRASVALSSLLPQSKPIIMSTDGVYEVSRLSFESFFEQVFSDGTRRRDGMPQDNRGMYSNEVTTVPRIFDETDADVGPCFDFEWMLSTGSNDRSYSQDTYGASPFLSRNVLMGNNYKQFEFQKPYILDGNELLSYTLKPTMGPRPGTRLPAGSADNVSEANFIVQMVTIGHKILGNGHVIPGAKAHY